MAKLYENAKKSILGQFWALFAQFFWKINFWDFFMFLDFYCCAKFLKKKFDFKVHPEGIPKLLVAKTYPVGSNPKVLYKNWKFWAILVIFYAKTKNQTIWLIEKKPRKNPASAQFSLDILQFNTGNYSWHVMWMDRIIKMYLFIPNKMQKINFIPQLVPDRANSLF